MNEAPASVGIAATSNQQQPAEDAGHARFVARQPIFDLRGRVHAYELLFRSGPANSFSGDGDAATRQMLDNAVLFGVENLSGGVLSFVNCTREALVHSFVEVLPPGLAVLEILETLEPEAELIDALKRLKAHGFRLALDDFIWRPELAPLVELADYIKVDFMQSGPRERKQLKHHLGGRPIALLAEKVETMDDYHRACSEGFTFFQGYYFCRPTVLKNKEIPANRLSQIELLAALQQKEFDLHRVTRMVMRDTAITFRLLRLVNSPAYAIRNEIRSVENALVTVGEKAFRRIVTLAIACELNSGGSEEALRVAFARAHFCGNASRLFKLDSDEQYLAGLFSLLPAMLKVPMETTLATLPLRQEIRAALLGSDVPERYPLAWIEAIEQGDWSLCDRIASLCNVEQSLLVDLSGEATRWADTILH